MLALALSATYRFFLVDHLNASNVAPFSLPVVNLLSGRIVALVVFSLLCRYLCPPAFGPE